MNEQISFAFDQRWRHQKEYKINPGDCIIPEEYGVEPIRQEKIAQDFVAKHHYLGTFPAAHLSVGLWRKTGIEKARLVGVAVFSEGVRSHLGIPRWTGLDRTQGTELGRFVLLPEIPYNGESWFLKRAFTALKAEKPHFRAVVSKSDPVERWINGQLVKPGHYGTIYQASNAVYAGPTDKRKVHVSPITGQVIHGYVFDKAKKGLKGLRYATEKLLANGAEPPKPDEDPKDWIARVKQALPTEQAPGKHTYVFGLDQDTWENLRKLHNGGLPYPKARNHRPRLATAKARQLA